MQKRNILTVLLIVFINTICNAQFSRYIIQLKDKTNSPFSINHPSQFLSQRAIDRRVRYSIAIRENDLPVNPAYLDSIVNSGNVIILNTSKWFNQVCIKTNDTAALAKINGFSFVIKASPVAAKPLRPATPGNKEPGNFIFTPLKPALQRPDEPNVNFYNYGLAYPQIKMHNADFLHNNGFRGNGLQMAITDAGFLNYNTLPTFDSAKAHNRILGTWDFVDNKASVSEENVHGMKCFSTIAANMPGKMVGTAPEASFYLYRTEDVSSEYPVEEQNWVAAAERADSIGVDLISVSLGYYYFDNSIFNYSYADMNGNTSLIAKGVNTAAQKGMLIVDAAGNEGEKPWHYISTPGDAKDALTVGAIDTNRQAGSFSSYGPSSSGQVKPDVAAVGVAAVVANQGNGQPEYGNGTSYACPIMAGITACLWQAFPEANNITLVDILHQSSDKNNNPDDRTGYGIPDAKKAFVLLLKKLHSQQINVTEDCIANYNWSVKAAQDMSFIIEKKLPVNSGYLPADTQLVSTGFSQQNFHFTDDLKAYSPGSIIKYRIKMNIAADTSFYLDSLSVNIDKDCNIQDKISMAPNPVINELKIILSQNTPFTVSVQLHNANGQLVYTMGSQQVNRMKTLVVPMKEMSKGIYYVTMIMDDKKKVTKKIIKL